VVSPQRVTANAGCKARRTQASAIRRSFGLYLFRPANGTGYEL